MNSNNFFQLVAEFQQNIDWLNQILKGDKAHEVVVDGVLKPSITKDINDHYSAILAMVQGRIAYETKSAMQADTTQPTNTLGQVWNDPQRANNGLYGWDGSNWVKSKYDDVSQLEKDVLSLRLQAETLYDLSRVGLCEYIGGQQELAPLLIDENNRVALQVDRDTGELVGQGLDRIGSINRSFAPVVSDESGRLALAVEKHSGRLLFDPHYATMLRGLLKVGMFADQNVEGVSFAIIDEENRIGFGLDDSGRFLVGSDVVEDDKVFNAAEINHFIFSGQSLSVGATGLPVISTTQPYGNLTFAGGPRSDLDELTSFKPLIEDGNPAPDGNTNRGETVCSGAANFVTELIDSEDGIKHTDHHYDMLSSTVGHGGYKIRELNKGTPWYQYLVSHIQAGFDLSVVDKKSFALQAIGWLQGENDQFDGSKPRGEYKDDLIQYQKDVQADARSITGQDQRVPLFSYQLACYVRNGGAYRNVTLAQLDASEQHSDVYIAAPMYHVQYATDNVHLTNVGYKHIGHYFGKVYKRVVFDRKEWKPLSPVSVKAQGQIISVEMHVPVPPIKLDTQTLPLTQDYGFAVEDDTGLLTIESVEVIGANRVKIIVNRPLGLNPYLRYGLDYIAPGLSHSNGGSGNLRDSDPLVFTHDSTDYPLFNWCVMFEKEIK